MVQVRQDYSPVKIRNREYCGWFANFFYQHRWVSVVPGVPSRSAQSGSEALAAALMARETQAKAKEFDIYFCALDSGISLLFRLLDFKCNRRRSLRGVTAVDRDPLVAWPSAAETRALSVPADRHLTARRGCGFGRNAIYGVPERLFHLLAAAPITVLIKIGFQWVGTALSADWMRPARLLFSYHKPVTDRSHSAVLQSFADSENT